MKDEIIDWLLKADSWTAYRTRVDILNESPDSREVLQVRERMVNEAKVVSILDELSHWPGTVLNSHKSAGQSFHKLSFIADLGIKKEDDKVPVITERIFEHISEEGPFQLPTNVPVHFGGSGLEQHAWALCDAPVIVYSLARLGFENDPRVLKAKNYLKELGRGNGYPCAVSRELGKFRGPGKKEDPCPYATLVMLKLLNLYEDDRHSEMAGHAAESLLNLWENSQTMHPYMFYMGIDFRKLKAPFIWYDILHVADTLSNFPQALADKRFLNMVNLISPKANPDGLYTPESEWKAWKDWDFGQKKKPSAWLTFLIYRIINRLKLHNEKPDIHSHGDALQHGLHKGI